MPLRHFVHVVGFEVPAPGREAAADPLVVLLDKVPVAQWRAVFQMCVEELAPGLLREPVLSGDTIRFRLAGPMTRRQAADIRAFVDRVNRLTFLGDKGLPRPL